MAVDASPPFASSRPDPLRSVRQMLAHPMAEQWLIIASTALLVVLGSMMVLSASVPLALRVYEDPYFFVKRQIVFLLLGVVGAAFLSRASERTLKAIAWVTFVPAVLLLCLLFTPLGDNRGGNTNWVNIGIPWFSLQPSEAAKLSIILWGAVVLAAKEKLLDQPKHLLIPYLPGVAILVGLTLLGGDLGTAIVMGVIIFGVLWLVGTPFRVLAALVGVALAGIGAMVWISPNRMNRFIAFLEPVGDTTGINMQPTLALWGMASGGWWGVGLGESRLKWSGLGEAHTDFVFAVIGEELGLVGSLTVLLLFGVLGYAGLRVAIHSTSRFLSLVAGGITIWFLGQALINVAVVLRMAPVMGVPLPFVSYGGSAMLANLAALGILIACSRRTPRAVAFLAGRSRGRVLAVVGSRQR